MIEEEPDIQLNEFYKILLIKYQFLLPCLLDCLKPSNVMQLNWYLKFVGRNEKRSNGQGPEKHHFIFQYQKDNVKECSLYQIIALISHAIKIILINFSLLIHDNFYRCPSETFWQLCYVVCNQFSQSSCNR